MRETTLTIGTERMPALGLGTWKLEGDDCDHAVRAALDLGYRHLDTAQIYDNEDRVGRAIEASGVPRDEIFLTTKVWLSRLAPDQVLASTAESLERLRTDHVELLLIHWPVDEVPLEETLRAMMELRERGRVREIGVSNFPAALLRRATQLAPVRVNQVEHHPLLGQEAVRTAARETGVVVTAYSPLAHGRVLRESTLREIAERHGTSVPRVVLRWLLDQPGVAVVPKASSREHLEDNLGALDLRLDDGERARIDALARGERVIDPEWAPAWDAA